MKHIEVSKKIELVKSIENADVKNALIERLEKTFEIETVSDGLEQFKITATTGPLTGITRHARVNLDVSIHTEKDVLKILISGYSKTAKSLVLLYLFFLMILLLVGLLPGSIETSGDDSGAMDMLVFMLFGGYIIFDSNKKLTEPSEFLNVALNSIDTKFGR